MSQKILTGLGAVEYVDVTVPRDPADTGYQVAFGTLTAPGEWQTPDDIVEGSTTVTLRLLVGNGHYNPVANTYSVWWRKSTDPEHFVRDTSTRVVIVTDGGTSVGVAGPGGVPFLSAPPDPAVYPAYIDISTVPPTLQVWTGSAWIALSGGGGANVPRFPSATRFPSTTDFPKAA
jgi:hypothetical protein